MGRQLLVLLCALTLSACGRGAPAQQTYETARQAPGAALAGPLASDATTELASWVDGQTITDWPAEVAKRERAIAGYLDDADQARAQTYGFRAGQNPRLAWDWFRHNPVGFNGVPFVLLKTLLDLDPEDSNPTLRAIARIWKRPATLPDASGAAPRWTLDHLGIGPDPADYTDGISRPASARTSPLPFGFAFENSRTFAPLSTLQATQLDARLLTRRVLPNSTLLLAKLRTVDHEDNWENDRPGFGSPGTLDRVFFSCAACHVGRVIVGGKMKFLPGMPNTEIEAQYYSKLLMLTGAALVESGFDPASTTPANPAAIRPKTSAVRSVYTAMLDKARQRPETLYGSSPADIARGKMQVLAVATEFPSVIKDLIAVAVKTHFIYHVVAKNNGYQRPLPDVFEDRPGQMDAFGIASGLVAIHTRRPDNSFMEFVRRDNPNSPLLNGLDPKAAGERILKNIKAWAPPVPAPIDIKSVNWATSRYHANWDGNQGASSRTLASGASATGDPRMVNVRIHEPLNPFIDNLPPPPYPFPDVDLARAREGKALFASNCATCHSPRNQTIYPARTLGVDPNRTLVTTSVSRYGLAALVTEACRIYGLNSAGQPGADWCVPAGDWQARLDEYFRDTPRRVAEGTNGYKADVLHGIWAQAPYLHNGSVPTLGQLICAATRPRTFLRGNVHYDQALLGFEWADQPTARYGPDDALLVKQYDTTAPSKSNGGHVYGGDLCPDTAGLDPRADRQEITRRIVASPVGALLAYLKTL
jgi:hypothetical protein